MSREKNIFLIWHKSQARVNSMTKEFCYKPFYITSNIKSKKLQIIDYLIKFSKTLFVLFKNRPSTVWVQLPPSVILFAILIYKIFYSNCTVISDCHNGQFRQPWINFPFSISLINKYSDLIIVHNEDIYKKVLSQKILDEDKIFVLEDNIPNPKLEGINIENKEKPIVLFPASFKDDEPIKELINATKELTEIQFIITGNVSNEKLANHSLNEKDIPNNVIFTGWISNQKYNQLLIKADLILGLTIFDDIQLSVAIEGVGYEKPMVLSNTKTLNKLFGKGTIFIENNSNEISNGISQAFESKDILEMEIRQLKKDKLENWYTKANQLKELLRK